MGAFSSEYVLMQFRWEPLQNLLQSGLRALGGKSWAECGLDKDVFNYNPDFDRYANDEKNNSLRIMAVRDDIGDLVGYATVRIFMNLHDKEVLCAVIQDIFIEPHQRKGGTADKLLELLEVQLMHMKVKHMSVASRSPVIDKWFSQRGYNSHERIWTKVLRSMH